MKWYEVYDTIFKTDLNANEKLVLLTFYRWTDGGIKSCWHGLKVISKTTSLSVRTCRNTINSLQRKGLLSVEHRLATSNLYNVSVENLQNYKSMTPGRICRTPRQDLPHPQAGFAAPLKEQDDFVHPPMLDPTFLNKNDVHPHSIVRHSEPGEGLSSPALRLDNDDIKQTIINNEQNESFQDDVVGPSFIIRPSFPSSLSSFLSFSSSPSFFPSPFSPPITPSLSSPLFPSSSPQPIHPSNSSSKPPLQKNKTKKVFHFKKQTLEVAMNQQEQDKRKSYINAVNDKWKTYKPAVKPIKFTSDLARSICARIEENSLDEFLLTIDWLFQDKHKKSRAAYLRENKYDSLETLSRPTKFSSYLNFALEWKADGGEQSNPNDAESTGDNFLDMLYGKGKYAKQSYIDAEFEDKEPFLFQTGGNNGK